MTKFNRKKTRAFNMNEIKSCSADELIGVTRKALTEKEAMEFLDEMLEIGNGFSVPNGSGYTEKEFLKILNS